MFKKTTFAVLALVLTLTMTLAACGGNGGGNANEGGGNTGGDNGGDQAAKGAELGDTEISIPYVAWAGTVARTNLIAAVLEDIGYTVELKQVGAGPMWSSVADGSADFHAAAWLPTTHQSYWKKYKDQVVNVKKILDKAPLALTVPSYMKIDSIKDLKGNTELGEKLDWTITGIDPGAGIMSSTKKAMKKYGLDKWKLQASSGPAMTGALKSAIEDKEPIVVTLWKPHWAFGVWDLKMLKDPKKVYGGDGDHINIIARKGLKEDSPAAYKFLEQYTEDYEQLNALMAQIFGKDKDPKKVAEQFIKEHPDLIDKWTKGIAAQ